MSGAGRIFKRGEKWWVAFYGPKDGKHVEFRAAAMVPGREGEPPRAARIPVGRSSRVPSACKRASWG